MKKGLLTSIVLLLSFFTIGAYAQTISGTVTDESGEPVPGVTVLVKGTTSGAATDVNGNYSISASSGDVLVFQGIGMAAQEVTVGSETNLDITMSEGYTELTDVIVTAQGIETERVALGYGVTSVSSKQIEGMAASEGDVGRILRGKAAGLNVTQNNGLAGSGTNIVIRGYTSITGSNQPLFVVDGVPFDAGTNDTGGQNSFADGGNTASSRFLDLDPNNIESVEVLKGLSATVLYGDRGRNGVILITTKNAGNTRRAKKTEVTASFSVFRNEIASLPDYQDDYGNGFHQSPGFFFSNWGPRFSADNLDALGGHPYDRPALNAAFPEFVGAGYDYRAYDNVSEFFRTGITRNASIGISGGTDKAAFSASYNFSDELGFTPGNELTKNVLGLGGRVELTNNITLSATLNYANTDVTSPPYSFSSGSGSDARAIGGSIFGDVFYTPRSVDLMGLPFVNPSTGESIYYRAGNDIQNPRWTAEYARNGQLVDRFWGQTSVKYDITDWLNLTYRIGLDTYTEKNFRGQSRGGVDGIPTGFYETTEIRNQIINHDWILSANKRFGDFSLNALLGFNNRTDRFERTGLFSQNQEVFGVLQHYNFKNQTIQAARFNNATQNLQLETTENRLGYYGQAVVGFRDYVYLTLAGRYDQSNTVESTNQGIFYPGASIAFDATEAIDALNSSSIVNFLKVRFAYGESANFPGAYFTRNRVLLNAQRFSPAAGGANATSNTTSNVLGNPDLTPERIREFEVGLETQLFDNRLSMDISLYQKNTTDLILNQNVDPSTGFTQRTTNAGEVEAKGIEIQANGLAVKAGDFSWNVGALFNAYENTVVDLPDDIDEILLDGFTNIGSFVIEGQPFGVIQGNYVQTVDDVLGTTGDSRRVVNNDGTYLESQDSRVIGDPNPDWLGTLNSTFSWKGLSLFVEFQYQQGGDIYSQTASSLLGRGATTDTDFDRQNVVVLPGVNIAGADTDTPVITDNSTIISATTYYFNVLGFGADEFRVWDASNIRLNELSLSYSLPKSILENTPIGSAQISLSGYNLWYSAFNMPKGTNVDPNLNSAGVGNALGLDFITGPSVRRYGATVRLTF